MCCVLSGIKCAVWCLVHVCGIWNMVCSGWCVACGVGVGVVCGVWCLMGDMECDVCLWCVVLVCGVGVWCVVYGVWPVVWNVMYVYSV